MAFCGENLYLGWSSSVFVLDLSKPGLPELVKVWQAPKALGLERHYCHILGLGGLLFVGSYHRKLICLDGRVVPIPRKPSLLGSLDGLPTSWMSAGEDGIIYRICLDRLLVIRYHPHLP